MLKHAESENCVIIGRCADYLLRERENVIRCYIFAPYQARIRNSIMTLGLANAEPQRIIEEVDKHVQSITARTPAVRSTIPGTVICF